MSNVIILYGVLVIVILRGTLGIYEIVAHRASRRRLEQELDLALTGMLATTSQETVTAAAVASVRRTRRMR